jgi:MFS family permease
VLGPLLGGFLVEHFSWGSVFLINVPIVIVGLVAGVFLIPTSKDPAAPKLDPVGAGLSFAGLVALLYGIIEAPQEGWTDPTILAALGLGLVILGCFLAWELRSEHPMLDIRFFRNPRFSAASFSIMLVFFSMLAFSFLVTQYFQFVLGYSPAMTGLAFLPAAAAMLILAPLSARFVSRFGSKLVVSVGLVLTSVGIGLMATVQVDSSYFAVLGPMVVMMIGVAITMAPATESIMGSLPLAKSGVGSAVNDTTRELGGALGIAIIGSLLTSVYATKVGDFLDGKPIPTPVRTRSSSHWVRAAVGKRFPSWSALRSRPTSTEYVGLLVAAVVMIGACRSSGCRRAAPVAEEAEPARTATTDARRRSRDGADVRNDNSATWNESSDCRALRRSAASLVALLQVIAEHPRLPPSIGDVLAGELHVHTTGPHVGDVAGSEEAVQLSHDLAEIAGLVTARVLVGVAVHRVAHPDHRVPGELHGPQQRRERARDAVRSHPAHECEPTGASGRVEPVAQRDHLVGRGGRSELTPIGFPMPEVNHVGAVELPGALADPEHVGRAVVPVAGEGVLAGERFLVAEDEGLVRGVEVHLLQPVLRGEVDAARP